MSDSREGLDIKNRLKGVTMKALWNDVTNQTEVEKITERKNR